MKKLIVGLAALALVAGIWRWRHVDVDGHAAVAQRAEDAVRTVASAARGPASLAPIAAPAKGSLAETSLRENEKDSVRTLAQLLASYQRTGGTAGLSAELKRANLEPVVSRDKNPDTGELDMVRTGNTLPGTRYFHAQVFEDGTGAAHIQHLSFEVRPGKDSFDVATSLVKQTFRDLGNPLEAKENYVLWRNRDGRIVSVRRLGPEDLKGNYFNAHAPEDVGTVWVVSEDDPEERGE